MKRIALAVALIVIATAACKRADQSRTTDSAAMDTTKMMPDTTKMTDTTKTTRP